MHWLMGVPGKLKTLLDRLTETRAGYLDTTISSRLPGTTTHRDRIDAAISSRQPNWGATTAHRDRIDAAISSRAPASTALSTDTWTNARAANIDNIKQRNLSAAVVLTSNTAISTPAITGVQQHITTSLTFITVVDISGAGVAEFAVISGNGTYSGEIEVTLDGHVHTVQSGANTSRAVIGAVSDSGGVALQSIPFATQFRIRMRLTSSSAAPVSLRYKYYLT